MEIGSWGIAAVDLADEEVELPPPLLLLDIFNHG